jgi:Tfp pilus assembly protein PilX
MPYAKNLLNPQVQAGYVLPLALTLILLTSVASASAIHTASIQIRSLGSEKQYLQAFHLAEVQLVATEKLLLASTQQSTNSTVSVESFKPKYFRAKSGVSSQHYKITVTSPINHLSIQTSIRIDETTKSLKNKSSKKERSLQRLSWELLL